MVDVSLLESFPFLTSFYGNGETKFPKTLTIFVRFCSPERPQRSVRESGSIAYRRRAMPLGRCHRSRRCPLRWSDRVTRRKCDRELTTRDDAPLPDFPDALHNSVPFPALPPTFDRQHAARPRRLWCRFSLVIPWPPPYRQSLEGQQLPVRRILWHRLRGNARSLFGDTELLPSDLSHHSLRSASVNRFTNLDSRITNVVPLCESRPEFRAIRNEISILDNVAETFARR